MTIIDPLPATTLPQPQAEGTDLLDLHSSAKTIAQLRAQASDDAAFRKAVVAHFAQALADGRARARANLEAGGRGMACARTLSRLEDDLIACIFDYVCQYVHEPASAREREHLCIIAVGGYGRATLAPGSDIDLLFLLPNKATAWSEKAVQAILYVLWDLRQKVGHATRTIDETLKRSAEDMTIRTTVLEARLILGDRKLFDELQKRFDDQIVRLGALDFVTAKLAERDQRVGQAGSSRYLVEPNVKEGKGGIRDLNTLFWIGKYVYRVPRASELVTAGLFTPREFQLACRCEEFLWAVRCHLHFVSGRAEERLSFDFQRQIADRLGYTSRAGQDGVERFMKHYFLVAKNVGDLTASVCAALEERQAKPRAILDRFVGRFRRRRPSVVTGDFIIDNDRINVASPTAFERDPVNLIRIFHLADETGVAIHPEATRLVTRSLARITYAVRHNKEANRLFLEILTSRHVPETVLRLMNEAGVLGRFIPEFGRVVAMMQFNMYHHYTVDEHLLRTVGVLANIEGDRFSDDHPLATQLIRSIQHRRALYVAVFLHDIAKGRPEDHSIAGAAIARTLCPRLGLTMAETDVVAWLIENHLVMSNTAQGRDLSDPGTIASFASLVQTMERLRLLLILTICDTRAVGPGVWNGWKGELLRTLYWETEVVLGGGHSSLDRNRRVQAKQDELRLALPQWTDEEFATYASRHYPAYWLKVDVARQLQHAKLLQACALENRPMATQYFTDAFRGVTELTVVAPDHPRLLAIIAGACAASGANIVDAHIFTTTDGLALDSIFISRAFEQDCDELRRAEKVTQTIEQALQGGVHISTLVKAKGGLPKGREETFRLAPEVSIDNNLSTKHTVIEVSGLDRPGLLYDLTNAISKLNLNIGSSHIVTFGEKAVDTFYVTDLTGAKITNPARASAVRRLLLETLHG